MKNFITLLISLLAFHVSFASPAIDSLKKIAASTSFPDTVRINALIELDEYYRSTNEIMAIKYGKQAIQLALKTKNKKAIINTYVHHIGLFVRKRNFIKAYQQGNEALAYFSGPQNKKYRAELYNILGTIAFHSKDSDNAITYIKKSIHLSKGNVKNIDMSLYMSNLGNAYLQKKNHTAALKYYRKSLWYVSKEQENLGDKQLLIISNQISIASAYTHLNQLESAKYYFDKASVILQKGDHLNQLKIYYLTHLSNYYSVQKRNSQAIQTLNEALKISRPFPNLNLDILLELSQAHEQIGNISESLTFLKQRNHLSDSLTRIEKNGLENVIRLNFKMEQEEHHHQQQLLSNRLTQKKATYQFRVLLLLTITIFLFSVLVINFFRFRSKRIEIEKDQITLKNKNMSLELEKSNIGITNSLLRLANMNEFMISVQKELETNKGLFKKEHLQFINRVSKKIKSNTDSNLWQEFDIRFNQLHQSFYQNICDRFPNLSQNERRLLTFLKLNLSSKEIASITGQSTNSITVARVRLRTKLGITNSGVGLIEFISQF